MGLRSPPEEKERCHRMAKPVPQMSTVRGLEKDAGGYLGRSGVGVFQALRLCTLMVK